MTTATIDGWESAIAQLLGELSATQSRLLDLLARKQALLARADTAGLAELVPAEEELLASLQACHDRRAKLLSDASQQGLPGESLRALAGSLPRAQRQLLARQLQEAASRSRILRHHSLTNWVIVQRTLLHLAQVLEIIATGGRPQPTYGDAPAACSSGSLVDQAA